MSRDRQTTRRSLIVLTPLIAWLVLGAFALHARPPQPERTAFCRRADSVVWPATRAWNEDHPESGATEDPEAFAPYLAERIDQADLAARAPASMRPQFATVARQLVRADETPRSASAATELADAIERLLAAYQRECARS